MWAQAANVLIGLWLMAAPAVLHYGGAAADNDRIAGPVAASFAAVAMSEVARPVRRLNVLVGAWLLLAAWALDGPRTAIANDVITGAVVVGLSCLRGKVQGEYGGGWSALWSRNDARAATGEHT